MVAVHAFNFNIQEAEAGISSSCWPTGLTQDSQGYIEIPCLEKSKERTKGYFKLIIPNFLNTFDII